MPRHIKKFMNGEMTPQELHAMYGVNKPCVACGMPATYRVRVLGEYNTVQEKHPEFIALLQLTCPEGARIPTIKTTYGEMLMLHDVGSCDMCSKLVQTRLAVGASDWMIVEIGKKPDNPKVIVS